jgi:hypothetical protein
LDPVFTEMFSRLRTLDTSEHIFPLFRVNTKTGAGVHIVVYREVVLNQHQQISHCLDSAFRRRNRDIWFIILHSSHTDYLSDGFIFHSSCGNMENDIQRRLCWLVVSWLI